MREEDEAYFNDSEFQENLRKYELADKSGEPIYMDAEDLTDIAEYYMTQNREEEANKAISLALSLHPNSVDPLIFLARQQMFHDNLEEATRIADSIPDQNDRETIFLWTELMIRSDETEEACKFITSKMEELDGEKDMFLYDAACIFMDYQEYEIAEELAQRLEKDFPGYGKLSKLKTDILMATEKYDQAIELLQAVLDEQPYNTMAWNKIAEAHIEKGDFAAALDSIEYSLAINPEHTRALMIKAHSLFHLNQLEQSHDIYLKLEEMHPENGRFYYLDSVTLSGMEKYDEAREMLDKAQKYFPEDDEEISQVYLHKAFLESRRHNIDEAVQALKKAVTLSQGQQRMEFQLMMGEILLENNREREAAEYFEAAYNESENKQQTLLTIAILYTDTMHYGTALSLLLSYIEENKDGVLAFPYMAYCYKKIHDQENYLKYLRKSVEVSREITEYLFSEDYPSIQPEEYYLYAFKDAYGRFPEDWE
ncbi:MAG: tetratricopeptide repeat protein [Bacteroidaceae bacterium]|nr:tetratricopeptide repeat protein [Bacteroidaceae bacterium]